MRKAGDDLKDNTKQTSLKKDDIRKHQAKGENEQVTCGDAY